MNKYFLLFLIITFTLKLDAIESDRDIYDLIDEENSNSAEIFEKLEDWYTHKKNLNQISKKALESFPLYEIYQMDKIIEARQKSRFKSWQDLAQRTTFNNERITQLKNYFLLEQYHQYQNQYDYRVRIETHFPLDPYYKNGKYNGSPFKIDHYAKCKIQESLTMKFRMEKDAGEKLLTDHMVGFIEWQHPSQKLKLITGTYQVNFGLGLTLSSPYGISPNGEPVRAILKQSDGIKGYSYASESNYMTGCALSKEMAHWQIEGFYARNRHDATLNSANTISSFYTAGYHRTRTESEKINQLQENLFGAHVSFTFDRGQAGMAFYKTHFSKEMSPTSLQKSFYDFKGNQNHVIGIHYRFKLQSIQITGESAQSQSKGWAHLHAINYQSGTVQWCLAWRNLDPDFQNFYGYCFQPSPRNIQGYYLGVQFKLNKKMYIKAYADQWKRKWRTYTTPIPGSGQKLMIQFKVKKIKNTTLKIRWIRKIKNEFISTLNEKGMTFDQLVPCLADHFRVEIQQKIHKNWSLKGQVSHHSITTIKSETGILGYLGIQGKINNLFIKARWTLFNTESWYTRIYLYEFDLPGKLSIPVYYDQGASQLLFLKWRYKNQLDFSVRYRRIYTGPNNSSQHEIGLQLEWKY